jgi:spore coat polysaccharide biosynthesis protein SpsF (cytidylyltransferase family)
VKVVAILQARMGSTRLPGKSMLPLAGKPMVQNIIERVQRATKLDAVVLALPSGEEFLPVIKATGVKPYAAVHTPENDLVTRYLHAAEFYAADIIVRVCCDNPCIEPEYIDEAVEAYFNEPYTFYSNTTVYIPNGVNGRPLHVDGLGCEVFSMSRLRWLDRKTRDNEEQREHPHKYFVTHAPEWPEDPDHGISISSAVADIRLDVNTKDDYKFIKSIYDHFGHNRFHISEILDYLAHSRGI